MFWILTHKFSEFNISSSDNYSNLNLILSRDRGIFRNLVSSLNAGVINEYYREKLNNSRVYCRDRLGDSGYDSLISVVNIVLGDDVDSINCSNEKGSIIADCKNSEIINLIPSADYFWMTKNSVNEKTYRQGFNVLILNKEDIRYNRGKFIGLGQLIVFSQSPFMGQSFFVGKVDGHLTYIQKLLSLPEDIDRISKISEKLKLEELKMEEKNKKIDEVFKSDSSHEIKRRQLTELYEEGKINLTEITNDLYEMKGERDYLWEYSRWKSDLYFVDFYNDDLLRLFNTFDREYGEATLRVAVNKEQERNFREQFRMLSIALQSESDQARNLDAQIFAIIVTFVLTMFVLLVTTSIEVYSKSLELYSSIVVNMFKNYLIFCIFACSIILVFIGVTKWLKTSIILIIFLIILALFFVLTVLYSFLAMLSHPTFINYFVNSVVETPLLGYRDGVMRRFLKFIYGVLKLQKTESFEVHILGLSNLLLKSISRGDIPLVRENLNGFYKILERYQSAVNRRLISNLTIYSEHVDFIFNQLSHLGDVATEARNHFVLIEFISSYERTAICSLREGGSRKDLKLFERSVSEIVRIALGDIENGRLDTLSFCIVSLKNLGGHCSDLIKFEIILSKLNLLSKKVHKEGRSESVCGDFVAAYVSLISKEMGDLNSKKLTIVVNFFIKFSRDSLLPRDVVCERQFADNAYSVAGSNLESCFCKLSNLNRVTDLSADEEKEILAACYVLYQSLISIWKSKNYALLVRLHKESIEKLIPCLSGKKSSNQKKINEMINQLKIISDSKNYS